jgi:hypothetical protein
MRDVAWRACRGETYCGASTPLRTAIVSLVAAVSTLRARLIGPLMDISPSAMVVIAGDPVTDVAQNQGRVQLCLTATSLRRLLTLLLHLVTAQGCPSAEQR